MSTLTLILLLGLAAQEHRPNVQGFSQSTPFIWGPEQNQALMPGNTCFAIRSYIFQRQDGNAPVLIRTTTCTPASTLRAEEVANPPKARLVPQ